MRALSREQMVYYRIVPENQDRSKSTPPLNLHKVSVGGFTTAGVSATPNSEDYVDVHTVL